MVFPIHTIIVLVFIIGAFVLQFYLSKRESKWPGLVLPIICFLFSLLVPLNFVAPSTGVDAAVIFQMLLAWLLSNIPTIIMLAIYFSCREKFKRARQVNKMNIQDLD